MTEIDLTQLKGSAKDGEPNFLNGDSQIVLSQGLSFVDLLIYNRAFNGRKISSQVIQLASVIMPRYEASSQKLQNPSFDLKNYQPQGVLYGLLNFLHLGSVPKDYAGVIKTPEEVSNMLHDTFISKSCIYVIWGYLRWLAGAMEAGWQRDLRVTLDISEDYDKKLCEDILKVYSHNWKGSIVNEQEMICSVGSLLAFANLATAFLRPEMRRKKCLSGLQGLVFQHEVDAYLLEKLSKTSLLKKVVEWGVDLRVRYEEVNIMSSGIKITAHSQPTIYKIAKQVCAILDMEMPLLYIDPNLPGLNAYTTGADRPIIVLSRLAPSLLDEEELRYVIGHECGHIMCQHVKYNIVMKLLLNQASGLPFIGSLVDASQIAIGPLLYAWSRRSELSADRAGLLACQSLEVAFRTMLKMMGQPFSEYHLLRTSVLLEQSLDFQDLLTDKTTERIMNLCQSCYIEHPRMVFRALELLNWIHSGMYDEIMTASPQHLSVLAQHTLDDKALVERRMRVVEGFASWAREKDTSLSRKRSFIESRQMINHQDASLLYPFNTVAQILILEKMEPETQGLISTMIIHYVEKDNPHVLEIQRDLSFISYDEMSDESRRYFIENGGTKAKPRKIVFYQAK